AGGDTGAVYAIIAGGDNMVHAVYWDRAFDSIIFDAAQMFDLAQGAAPHGVAVDQANSFALVTFKGLASVVRIPLSQDVISSSELLKNGRVSGLGGAPHDVVVGEDGIAYIACRESNQVWVLDARAEEFTAASAVKYIYTDVPPKPTSLALATIDGIRYLFVGSEETTQIARLTLPADPGQPPVASVLLDTPYPGEFLLIFDPTVVGIAESTEPSRVIVEHPRPNPFNPRTEIHFTAPGLTQVTATIYDLMGQRVRELSVGIDVHGAGSVVWTGTDDAGREVSSGVYLAEIRMGDHRAVRRLVLVR
ncbi:MAG: FlgD immunoglobulin-like domain containing protein, partial [Candidatus Latescibacteria bacterium]|nr:FlgD immunoglobulin-like domain containing protein [Candidatus Latescibacterota bacterium]